MIPCREFDHEDTALALLTDAYKGRTNIEGILKAIARQFQDLEDATWQVIQSRGLGVATTFEPTSDDGCCECPAPDMSDAEEITIVLDAADAQLDVIGKLVGERRDGRSDADFLVGIRTRIKINYSAGRTTDILDVLALLQEQDPFPTFNYYEFYPAGFVVEQTNQNTAGLVETARTIKGLRAAGVRGQFYYFTEEIDQFTFAPSSSDVDDDTMGFDDEGNPDPSGGLMGVIET